MALSHIKEDKLFGKKFLPIKKQESAFTTMQLVLSAFWSHRSQKIQQHHQKSFQRQGFSIFWRRI